MSSALLADPGSSPRMRGARAPDSPEPLHLGIIPADAGSTAMYVIGTVESKDHPRGCGEHSPCATLVPISGGSSPRMRGAQPGSPTPARLPGIIPADAGSTMQINPLQ